MKNIVFTLLLILSLNEFKAQTTAIPDSGFELALYNQGYDFMIDGLVTTSNIDTITELWVGGYGISDLTGIEDFAALEIFYCYNNSLNYIDLSQNLNLKELHCYDNPLDSLDVSSYTGLTKLNCKNVNLKTLDLTQNINLKELRCMNDSLSSIDLSQNINLEYLDCSDNQITNLILNQNVNLEELRCRNNILSKLDLSQNDSLKKLGCGANQIDTLDLANNQLLHTVSCDSNQITYLNLTQCISLEYLFCEANQLDKLDLTQNSILIYMEADFNPLTCLNASNYNVNDTVYYYARYCPNLTCIEVDHLPFYYFNTIGGGNAILSLNCNNACSAMSVKENEEYEIVTYPNPTLGKLSISLKTKSEATITIYNIAGKKIFNKQYTSNELIEINLDTPNGIYFVRVETEKGVFTEKIIKE